MRDQDFRVDVAGNEVVVRYLVSQGMGTDSHSGRGLVQAVGNLPGCVARAAVRMLEVFPFVHGV